MIFLGSELIELYNNSNNNTIYSNVSELKEHKDIEKRVFQVSDTIVMSETVKQAVSDMKKEISKIADIGKTITEKKKVYFEIGSSSSLFSFGKNTFLNEMIELIGAENILGNEEGWVSPSEEIIIKDNPDVILTNEPVDNIIDTIKNREGWGEINAIKNNNVYLIDKNASSRPSQNIIKALKEMAKAIYPEKYE